jgi:hypothetical protein
MGNSLIYGIIIFTFCTAAIAQDLSTPVKLRPRTPPIEETHEFQGSMMVNLGTHTEFFNNIQVDGTGTQRKFDLAPTIGFGLLMPTENKLYSLIPELNWVLPRKAGSSEIIKNLFMIRGDFGYNPMDWLRLRVGTSLMWLNQHGRGGSAQVNNGNTTSRFYYPDENRTSLNNTLDLGLEAIVDKWAVRLQTYTYSAFREERRQVSYTLFISYYLDR